VGGYILPGLVDMHVHFPVAALPGEIQLYGLLFLAHGVTAVRDAGSIDRSTLALRRRSRAGDFVGPRVFACGPFLDGDPPAFALTRPERVAAPPRARAVVDELAEAGVDCIKVYSQLSAEALEAVRAAAGRHGLPVIGHVPTGIPFEQARLDDVQHLTGIVPRDSDGGESLFDWLRAWGELDAERRALIVAASVREGTAHTPTLAVSARLARLADYAAMRDEPVMSHLPRYYRDVLWNPALNPLIAWQTPADFALGRPRLEMKKQLVAELHAAGVPVFAGTDTAGPPFLATPFTVPGAALQEELWHLAAAGLTPEEIWISASRAPGDILGEPKLGILTTGAPADFLVLRGDPTRDLEALGTLEAVVVQGRLFTRTWLLEQLEQQRAYFEGPVYDWFSTNLARGTLAVLRRLAPSPGAGESDQGVVE
jgi:imidazolonepropionase-like amidohydrolase